MKYKFELKTAVRDTITGAEGKITARAEFIGQEPCYVLQQPVDKDLKIPANSWVHESLLEEIGKPTTRASTKTADKVNAKAEEKEITIEDVIAACQAHTAANGNDKKGTIEIIKSFGVANVKLLPKEKFAEIMKALA